MSNLQHKYEILSSSKVGIEFEFFTELRDKELSREISKLLGKKVIIPVTIVGLDDKDKGTYHSDIEPTSTLFKLEKDFSGGKDMFELITGPLAYEESRIIIIKMLQWIKSNGWTTEKCAIHLNVSFNEFKTKLRYSLMNLNVLKFILGFDEEFIYSRFPERRDNVYAKSIYNFYPISRFIFYENPDSIDRNDYIQKFLNIEKLKCKNDTIDCTNPFYSKENEYIWKNTTIKTDSILNIIAIRELTPENKEISYIKNPVYNFENFGVKNNSTFKYIIYCNYEINIKKIKEALKILGGKQSN